MFFKQTDYEGWTNWETWNTYLMLTNDQPMYEALNKIVRDEGTPQDIHDFAIQTVIAEYNANALEDAQEWNSVPEDERVDPHYQDLLDRLGLDSIEDAPDNVRNFHDLLGLGPDTEDYTPTLIDPDLVNWQEIHQTTARSIWEDEAYETPDQFNDDANPYLQDFVPDDPDDIKFSRTASIHNDLVDPSIYDTWTGLRLPWAKTAKIESVEGAGPYLRRVLKQPGKKLMNSQGEEFLRLLADLGEDVDPLTPWLVSQYKKGNLGLDENGNLVMLDEELRLQIGNELIEQMAQWYNATDHPTRSGYNVQEMSVYDVIQKTEQHQEALKKEAEIEEAKRQAIETDAETVHTFDNGWTIKELSSDDLWAEGKLLGHCIGGHGYDRRLNRKEIDVYSLRDPEGLPHATWHYNEDGELEEIQGKSGELEYGSEYRKMFEEWANLNGLPTETNQGLDYYNLGPVDDWWTFYELYSENADYGAWGLAADVAPEPLHEEAEINWGPIVVHDIVQDLFSKSDNTKERLDPHDMLQTVLLSGYSKEFLDQIDQEVQEGDIEESDPLLTPFRNFVEDFTNPETGELSLDVSGPYAMYNYDPETRQMRNPATLHPDDPDYKRTPKEQYEKDRLMPLFSEEQDWFSRVVDMRGAYPEDYPSWKVKPDFVHQVGQGEPRFVTWWEEGPQGEEPEAITWHNPSNGIYLERGIGDKGKVVQQETWLGPASPYFDRYRHRFPEGPDFVQ